MCSTGGLQSLPAANRTAADRSQATPDNLPASYGYTTRHDINIHSLSIRRSEEILSIMIGCGRAVIKLPEGGISAPVRHFEDVGYTDSFAFGSRY